MRGDTPNWKLRNLLKIVKEILLDMGDFTITHIYCEANKRADLVANVGVGQDTSAWIGLQDILDKETMAGISRGENLGQD
ncbi:hypothetical protein SUGI_0133620 [Cryptomeria japonica]|nr:hypothetical protein SUGI_0133620 [Cryptomeria japonica]